MIVGWVNIVIDRIRILVVIVEVSSMGCRWEGRWKRLKENSKFFVRYFV